MFQNVCGDMLDYMWRLRDGDCISSKTGLAFLSEASNIDRPRSVAGSRPLVRSFAEKGLTRPAKGHYVDRLILETERKYT